MNRKIRLTYILTHHIRWAAFEWTAKYIDRSKFDVNYIILNKNDPIIDFLEQKNIPYETTSYNNYGKRSGN